MQIDVALRFYGNSSLSYPVPAQASTLSNFTSVSLVFRPSQVDYGTLLHATSTGGMDSLSIGESEISMGESEMEMELGESIVSLKLYNGSVQFEYSSSEMGVLATEEGVLQEEEWYQVFATRYVYIIHNILIDTAPNIGFVNC